MSSGLFAGLNAQCLGIFGEPINYSPVNGGGGTATISGIWDESMVARETREDGSPSLAAKCWVLESDLPSTPSKGDVVQREGRTYLVRNDPTDYRDGMGGIWLHLRKR